jgi:hypothetical protein
MSLHPRLTSAWYFARSDGSAVRLKKCTLPRILYNDGSAVCLFTIFSSLFDGIGHAAEIE